MNGHAGTADISGSSRDKLAWHRHEMLSCSDTAFREMNCKQGLSLLAIDASVGSRHNSLMDEEMGRLHAISILASIRTSIQTFLAVSRAAIRKQLSRILDKNPEGVMYDDSDSWA